MASGSRRRTGACSKVEMDNNAALDYEEKWQREKGHQLDQIDKSVVDCVGCKQMKPGNEKDVLCRDCKAFCRKTMSKERVFECENNQRKCNGSGCKACLYERCKSIGGFQKLQAKPSEKCVACGEVKVIKLPKLQVCISCDSFYRRNFDKVKQVNAYYVIKRHLELAMRKRRKV